MKEDLIDLRPFFIEFLYKDEPIIAEVKPCCQEENVFYYDISFNNAFQFTITPNTKMEEESSWRVALANSDKKIDPQLAEIIGQHIQENLWDKKE